MIIAAAIKQGELIHSLPRPARHHDIIHAMVVNGYKTPITGEQGFINNRGRFLDRIRALQEAYLEGQVTPEQKEGKSQQLYSEDCW